MLLQDFSSPGLLAKVRLFSSALERSLVRLSDGLNEGPFTFPTGEKWKSNLVQVYIISWSKSLIQDPLNGIQIFSNHDSWSKKRGHSIINTCKRGNNL